MNQESFSKFGKAFWNQDQPVWALDLNGEVLEVNPYLAERFGETSTNWQQSNCCSWLQPQPEWARFCQGAEAKNDRSSQIKAIFEARLTIGGKDFDFFKWQMSLVGSEKANSVVWCWGTLLEESTRKNKTGDRDRRLLTRILDHSIDGMITIDTEGLVLSFNKAAERLFGFVAAEVLDRNVSMLMPSPHREKHDDYIQAYLRTGQAKIIGKGREVFGLRKDGTSFPMLLTTTQPFQIGKNRGFLGMVRDLSQAKSIENQLRRAQKMESIGTLAGGIAHDFNNILGGISGYIELMLEDAKPGSAFQEDLIEMKKACQRGRDLVLQILTFSRRDGAALEPMRLQPIIKESLKLLRATLPTTIKMTEDISPTCPAIVGDVTKIHQVLMNLGTNAFHAMGQDGGHFSISLDRIQIDDHFPGTVPNLPFGYYNRLQVKDSGQGIKPEHIQRIFDPFFTTKAVGEGTGMGLAVVHGIVQSHGGDIIVASKVGKGSVFSLFFPVHADDISEKSQVFEKSEQGDLEHLVLVDDDAMLLRVQSRILRRTGYQVTAFENARLAMAALLDPNQSFDLLLTDQTMPDMTGLELARCILVKKPDFPIILTTGFSEVVSREKIRELGILDLLMKPVEKLDLTSAIRKILDDRRTRN